MPISKLRVAICATREIKILALRCKIIPWQCTFGFKWSNTYGILHIHYDITNMGEVTKYNFLRKWEKSKIYLESGIQGI